jgi:hypothetical protein
MSVDFPRSDCNSSPPGAGPLRFDPAQDHDQHIGPVDEDWDDRCFRDPRDDPLDPDPEAVRERCVAAVQAWPVRAIGRRPADWLAHDLLVHRLLRDGRLSYFHHCSSSPSPG